MKKAKNVRQWIGNWTVSYDWEWRGQVLSTRRHDFRIETSRRKVEWYMFNRHVVNNDNGAEWIDAFDSSGGFVSFRPEQIIAVRPHKSTSKEVKKNVEHAGGNARGKAKGQPRERGIKATKSRRRGSVE